MRRIPEHVDEALIEWVFQPLVDRIAQHWPMDCFQLARVCTSISAVAWIWSQAGDLSAAVRSKLVGEQIFQAALLLLGLSAIMVLHTLFQRIGRAGSGTGRANPLRSAMYTHRLIVLSGLVVSIIKAAVGVGSPALLTVALSATAALYVGACSNPPPKPRERSAANGDRWLAALPVLGGRAP